MKLKRKTIEELRQILNDEYSLELPDKELTQLAYSLVGLFDLLERVDFRYKFQNRSDSGIDYK